mmetsp:Transcript_72354/g.127535  ORF Transcript_72354/g.127535 Transcript_72354/m.127535 type:complete len:119 (-) Transcript_72354:338-694(-)
MVYTRTTLHGRWAQMLPFRPRDLTSLQQAARQVHTTMQRTNAQAHKTIQLISADLHCNLLFNLNVPMLDHLAPNTPNLSSCLMKANPMADRLVPLISAPQVVGRNPRSGQNIPLSETY